MDYPPDLQRDDDYPLASEIFTIEPEIAGKIQHNLCALYFNAA